VKKKQLGLIWRIFQASTWINSTKQRKAQYSRHPVQELNLPNTSYHLHQISDSLRREHMLTEKRRVEAVQIIADRQPAIFVFIVVYLRIYLFEARCWWHSWLRHWATSRKVAGSIPDGVIGIFHWHIPSDRVMTLRLTQPLTEMSTRNISWG
jgi:hypothetical protein